MSQNPPQVAGQSKRILRKRSVRLSAERDCGMSIAAVTSEEKSFRVSFLSRETGIEPDQARQLVESIETDGAALLSAARQIQIPHKFD
jgi:hypothetical protein